MGPIQANNVVPSSRPTTAAHTDINDSHCLQRNDKDVKAALFRMHESESWGQVQQSMTGGGRRKEKDGGGVRGRGGQKERRGVKLMALW